jgi:hypothetical protein
MKMNETEHKEGEANLKLAIRAYIRAGYNLSDLSDYINRRVREIAADPIICPHCKNAMDIREII